LQRSETRPSGKNHVAKNRQEKGPNYRGANGNTTGGIVTELEWSTWHWRSGRKSENQPVRSNRLQGGYGQQMPKGGYYKPSDHVAGFLKAQSRRAGMEFARIPVTEVAQEIGFDARAGEERRIDLGIVKTRHGAAVQPQ